MNFKSNRYNKVLFIDDDVELVNFYTSILKQKNLSNNFLHFNTAKRSIDYLNSCQSDIKLPDYILLDLYMPEMTGFQFLKWFEKTANFKNSIEIFVCSSSQLKNDRDKVMKYPFVSAYLEKPIPSDFIELLIKGLI